MNPDKLTICTARHENYKDIKEFKACEFSGLDGEIYAELVLDKHSPCIPAEFRIKESLITSWRSENGWLIIGLDTERIKKENSNMCEYTTTGTHKAGDTVSCANSDTGKMYTRIRKVEDKVYEVAIIQRLIVVWIVVGTIAHVISVIW